MPRWPDESPAERLMRQLEKMPSGCWEFTGGRHTNRGYGLMWANGRNVRTHRLAYETARGPIPDGLIVMHSCDNPPCCNPAHLSIGTHKDNSADMWAKGRQVPPPRRAGLDHYRAKLSDEDVKEIRASRAAGETPISIAARFGVSASHVRNIVRGVDR